MHNTIPTHQLYRNYLFNEFVQTITRAKNFLYIEHQYPFHNYPLTYFMCQTLKQNPNLRVLIITPVRTDLPSGVVGEFVDWSQDHSMLCYIIINKMVIEFYIFLQLFSIFILFI